jgi:hypothetical protein
MAGKVKDSLRSLFGRKKQKRPTISGPIQPGAFDEQSSKLRGEETEPEQPQVPHSEESGAYDNMNETEEAAQSDNAGDQQTQDMTDETSETMAEPMNMGGPSRPTRPLSTVPEHLSHAIPEHLSHGTLVNVGAPDTMSPSPEHSFSRTYTTANSMNHTLLDATSTRSEHTVSSNPAMSALCADCPEQEPIGQWRCCKCKQGQDLYLHNEGPHLVSTLNCVCPHRSCENCTLTGRIKPYQPVQDPIPVPLSIGKHKLVRFGLFCNDCGLSWRAQVVKDSMLQHISAMPKNLAKQPLEKIRQSKSMSNLLSMASVPKSPIPKAPMPKSPTTEASVRNLRALSSEMKKQHGKQADVVMVTFSGIHCTCGRALDTSSLCFQVVEPPEEPAGSDEVAVETSRFTATLSDRSKGIGTSTITYKIKDKTYRYPNPLMSNPVMSDELARLMDKVVLKDGPREDSIVDDEYDSDATVQDV